MPIFDPSIQLTLCFNDEEPLEDNNFFLYYLNNASQNIYRSFESLDTSFRFETDLKDNGKFLNDLFKFNYDFTQDFIDPTIKNFYEYLYKKFDQDILRNISEFQKGQYYIYNYNKKLGDKSIKTQFFRPILSKSSFHSWYFTDSPIALLCVNLLISKKTNHDYIISELEIYLINLEIDLIEAAGYTLILSFITDSVSIKESISINTQDNSKDSFIKPPSIQEIFVKKTIKTHNFAEIHCNLMENKDKKLITNYDEFIKSIFLIADEIKGHFYIYAPFFKDIKSRSDILLKLLKSKERFHIFNFSISIKQALNLGELIGSTQDEFKCHPFPYLKTGYDEEMIRIILCNAPIYFYQDNKINTMPSERSYLNWAYISKENFNSWTLNRVPIIVDENSNTHHFLERFIKADDIHHINPEFFVNDTLYLTPTDQDTLKTVKIIQEKSKDKTLSTSKENLLKDKLSFNIKISKKIKKKLIFAAYRLQRDLITKNIFLYKSQIFTAYEAIRTCFSEEKEFNYKGFIYQVETGEGKSFIIQLIAAVISLIFKSKLFNFRSDKTVHIASSNIILANRDYCASYPFFKELGLKCAVLLHKNEIPNKEDQQKFYKGEYYKDALFKNSSNMNYAICGENIEDIKGKKVEIIFSTFVNFESFYLKMVETCQSRVQDHFRNCYLLIDEADSILIDELANGTILSRPMKTNCKEVLKYVYDKYNEGKTQKEIYRKIIKKWPNCKDLREEDINDMFEDIKLVNQEEFTNGKKYSIETGRKKKKQKLIRKITKKVLKSKKGIIDDDDDSSDFSDDEDYIKNKDEILDENEEDNEKYEYYKYIVPFDYDHKGVLEPNKEFSGYVQQFIAIKEMANNENLAKKMKIKELSMNYLYVSHQIYVKMYKAVCGFTGTLGNKFDKQIFKKQYDLLTRKIPRSKPNRRIELPTVLCNDLAERNFKIVNEVMEFHEKKFPVLVIFQDLTEITNVFEMLIARGIEYINVFEGKNEKIKPDEISGRKGAVSLGTNVCGRGTDIKEPEMPLHVIISYYSTNSRVMQQAFGRTSRQGRDGTVSIICLKDQYISPTEIMEMDSMKEILDEYDTKNKMQKDFIDDFRVERSWIFEPQFKKQSVDKFIIQMRKSKVNVNRIRAYKFEFPIGMSVPTFLMIQGQKIFSLYNCPNCKHTWKLFQRYVREMVLESWSLFIDKADKDFRRIKKTNSDISYKKFLESEMKEIKPWLNLFFPKEKKRQVKDDDGNITTETRKFDVVDTFIDIFNFISDWGQKKIDKSIPKKFTKIFQPIKSKYISINFGFKLYSLIDRSGARFTSIDGSQNRNYIYDPELLYTIQGKKKRFSITTKIDELFDEICKKLDSIIGSYTGLKLFLRRTLSGCEFGACFDFDFRCENEELTNNTNCIIDRDPLFLFTIILKSTAPLLAGILIIGLIYLAKLAEKITEFIGAFPAVITGEIAKKALKEIIKIAASEILKRKIEQLCEKVNDYLFDNLQKQIDILEENHSKAVELFRIMIKILKVKEFNKVGESIEEKFAEEACKIKMNMDFTQTLANGIPVSMLLKIGLLLLLCIAAFLMNFSTRKDELKYDEKKVAEDFDKNQDTKKSERENANYVNDEDFAAIQMND